MLEPVVILLIVLGLVTVIGHLLWVFFASVFRLLVGREGAESVRRRAGWCERCGHEVLAGQHFCAYCGLDRGGGAADELADLAAAARCLRQLHSEGRIETAVYEKIKDCIDARQAMLLGRPVPSGEAVPAAAAPVVAAPERTPPEELEWLLADCGDVRNLTLGNRLRAVALWRQLHEDQRASLSPATLWNLARVLWQSAFRKEAVTVYGLLLAHRPAFAGYAEAALEAACLLLEDDPERARWFVERAREVPSTAGTRAEIERLGELLAPVEELPEVEPVLPAETATAAETASAEVVEEPAIVEAAAAGESAEPPPPQPTRRRFAQLLGAFMEERNIFWGELVGGLLMVGCSVALVISLWSTLEEIPYFPFLIFAGITSGLFGAGLYTFHHWKLSATSRGLLVIATLLVPLNFVVLAGLAREHADDVYRLGTTAAGVALFTYLVRRAGGVLSAGRPWAMTLSVLVSAVSPLSVARFLGPNPPAGWFLLFGLVPAGCHLAGTLAVLYRRGPAGDSDAVHGRLAFLGVGTFALATALGFLIQQHGDLPLAWQQAAILLALLGVPIVLVGFQLHAELSDRPEIAGLRTIGTVLAGVGVVVLLSAAMVAWPQPHALLAVSLLDFAVLSVIAFCYQLPLVQAAALASLTLGYLAGYSLVGGGLSATAGELLRRFLSAGAGAALVGLAALVQLAAEVLLRLGQRRHGLAYAVGGGVIAACSLALVSVDGAAHPGWAAAVWSIYGAGCLVLNLRWRQPVLVYPGLLLLVGGSLWALQGTLGRFGPVWGAVVAAEGLIMALLADAARRAPRTEESGTSIAEVHGQPLFDGAKGAGILAMVLGTVTGLVEPWTFAHVVTGGCLTALYVVVALHQNRVELMRLAGLMLVGSVAALTGWAGTIGQASHLSRLLALSLATSGTGLAAVACRRGERRELWQSWREPALMAAVLALGLTLAPANLDASRWNVFTFALVSAAAFLLGWSWQARLMTWVGSGLLLGCLLYFWHALVLDWGRQLVGTALLTHALLTLGVGIVVRRYAVAAGRVIAEPLVGTAVASTVLALPVSLLVSYDSPAATSFLLGWLALVWLVLAIRERSAWVFAAFEGALSLAVLFGVSAWVQRQPWGEWDDFRSWQAGGIALAGLALLGVGVRCWLRRRPEATWGALLGGNFDRWLLRLLVVAQLLAAVAGLAWPLLVELLPSDGLTDRSGLVAEQAHGAGAWLLLGVLAMCCLALCWERRREAVLGLVVLAVSAPVLVAGPFGSERAIGVALRWGLAGCFFIVSVLIWLRESLERLSIKLGCASAEGERSGESARWLVLLMAVLPVLVLTAWLAMWQLAGQRLPRPLADTFFHQVGPILRDLVPLAVIALGLVGHALRERSAGFAFAAGLLVNVCGVGGYALARLLTNPPWQEGDGVRLVYLGTVSAAAWAIAWLAVPWLARAWPIDRDSRLGRLLMRLQLELAATGAAVLVGVGTAGLIVHRPFVWTREAGSVLGWSAVLLTLLAAGLWARRARLRLSLHLLGWVGLTFIALVACSIEVRRPGLGYRTLLLGLAGYALAWSMTVDVKRRKLRRLKALSVPRSSRSARAAASIWVPAMALATLLLAVNAVRAGEYLWPAAAIAVASPAGLLMAVRRRREVWALAGCIGFNLAASFGLQHFQQNALPVDALVHLLQANVVASAFGGLVWLALRRRIYRLPELKVTLSPLLAAQVLIGLAGNVALLGLPLVWFVLFPVGPFGAELALPGEPWGWLALVATACTAGWYGEQAIPRLRLPVMALFGLAAGVLAACSLSPFDTGNWLCYHALTTAWCMTGLVLLAGGWISAVLRQTSEAPPEPARAWLAGLLPPRAIRAWVGVIALAVILLAVRGWADRTGPWWSAGATLVVSLMLGGTALWSRQPIYVWISGLLINLVGLLIWLHEPREGLAGFIACHALCLAIASASWTAIDLAVLAGGVLPAWRSGWSFSRLAAGAGLFLLALNGIEGLFANWRGEEYAFAGSLGWSAWVGVLVAVLLTLWDAEARLPLAGLYVLGVLGLELILHNSGLRPPWLGWLGTALLAGHVLLATVVEGQTARWTALGRKLCVPERAGGWPIGWFAAAQATAGGLVAILSLWIVLDFASVGARMLAPVVVLMLLPEAVRGVARPRLGAPADAALLLVVLAVVEAGWALIPLDDPAPWLQRLPVLALALVLAAGVCEFGLSNRLPASPWSAAGRRVAPLLLVGAAASVLVILGLESLAYDRISRQTPMQGWAVGLVLLAQTGLGLAGLRYALRPEAEPLGLSERGRQLYVYGVELVLFLIFLHLRLNTPWLFQGVLGRYWTLIVMGIAFLGVGLGDFLRRRQVRVLAEPLHRSGLWLPLVPLAAFWLRLPQPLEDVLLERVPGLAPFLGYLVTLQHRFVMHASLWFLLGILFAWVAGTRRSGTYLLAAALTGNFGLWVMLANIEELTFVHHPQLWLVPIGLILLLAEHINRDRLGEAPSAALRYCGLLVIYLSSAADMFLEGLGGSWLLPLVLAVLAVAGILFGILMRLRAFLFTGVAFLFLVVFTQIWHAAMGRQQYWIWWASGIVLGGAIIALFALFEKRRNDVLHVMEQLKQWR